MLKKWCGLCLSSILFFSGCASVPQNAGNLGYSEGRNVVIIGENVDANLALYYQKKYDALVWFTPYQGGAIHQVNNFLESGFGPSLSMRVLIKELKSINDSVGQWTIYIPKIAEDYFLAVLKNMEDGSLVKARGVVVLIDSKSNKNIEAQLKRVTEDNFILSFGVQS